MNPLAKIQRVLFQIGAYKCPHFKVQKVPDIKTKKSCCGGNSDQYIPICTLINGTCPGLPACPRLDIKTKGELIKEWTEDLHGNRQPNPIDYIK